MNVTRELISRILDLKEMFLSFQTGFNLENAAPVCAILESISGLEPLWVITDDSSKPEILSRMEQTTAALTRLKPVWNDRSTSLKSKIRLMRSLVTSIFLYAGESWTLTAELQRRKQAREMRWYRKILCISYKDHDTNEEVRARIQQTMGLREDLLATVKRRKLQSYGHVSRSSGLAKTILQGTVKEGRRQVRQRKRWEDNIREWTGLEFAKSQRAVEIREKCRKLVAKSSVVPQRPSRLRDRWDEMMRSAWSQCLNKSFLFVCLFALQKIRTMFSRVPSKAIVSNLVCVCVYVCGCVCVYVLMLVCVCVY